MTLPLPRRRVLLVALLLIGLAVILACGKRDQPSSGSAGSTPAPTLDARADVITVRTVAGAALPATLLRGTGADVVVMASANGRDPSAWQPLSLELYRSGLSVLTLAPLPAGSDEAGAALLRAAVAALRERGLDRVVLLAEQEASGAALLAGPGSDLRGVALVSPRVAEGSVGAAASVGTPLQIVEAAANIEGAVGARRLYDAARAPRELALVPGTGQGAALVGGDSGATTRDLMQAFIREALAALSA